MLGLQETLARLIYEKGKMSPGDVDVRFEAPRRDVIGALTRPTINFYLHTVEENTDLRHANLQMNRMNGATSYALPPRRFDLRFMVSVLTTRVEDELVLLWRVLAVLLRNTSLPVDLLPASVAALDVPVTASVVRAEDESFSDLWGGMETYQRPSLLYVVTLPIDLEMTIEAPLVFTRTAHYAWTHLPDRPVDTTVHIGGYVRDGAGQPVANATVGLEGSPRTPARTDAEGRFVLVGVPSGTIPIRVVRPGEPPRTLSLTVPSDDYELVLS